ncbi:pectin acetylesterase-family hydrolase [Streptosporangium sp. NPDC006013]|uniref:pectin acetylesterase-family hydrolase n=1 Tax=Streptosporangium sp. NPDC006013 TaxID=3155596 RepID=UPI0033BE8458
MNISKWVGAAAVCALVAWGLAMNPLAAATAIAAVSLLAFLYLYFIKFARPSEVAGLHEATDNEWHTVKLGSSTKSSDRSDYAVYVRRGASENLVIHFSGGGACWDGITASRPITLAGALRGYTRELKMFYFKSLTKLFPAALGGIADQRDTQNAFRDWNFVFIPYSTGDLHVGDVTNTYTHNGKNIVVHHNGRQNSKAALDWVYKNFPAAGKVMVSGESSGAWASAFYAPQVADHYAESKVYCLSDGVGIVSARWRELLDDIWKSDSANTLGFEIRTDVFEDSLIRRTDSVTRDIKYLHSNTLYDDTLTRFDAALNQKSTETDDFIDDWAANTKASVKRIRDADIRYDYFLTTWGHNPKRHTTEHTLTTNEFYNKCTADGVSFSEWVKRNVIDDEDVSLGRSLLQ